MFDQKGTDVVTRCMMLAFCVAFAIEHSVTSAQPKPHRTRTRVEISALIDATTRHLNVDIADIFQFSPGGIAAPDQLGYLAIEVPIEGTTYTLDLAVSRHTLSELEKKPDAALRLAEAVTVLPHVPVGGWDDLVATWDQLEGSLGRRGR